MKKLILLSSALLGVVFLAGCGQQTARQTQSTIPAPAAEQPAVNQTADWKKYSDASLSFEYPALLSVKQEGKKVTLNHSIAYKHENLCNFSGDGPTSLDSLTDFDVFIKIFNKNLKDTIQSNAPGDDINNFLENNTLKLSPGYIDAFNVGSLKGFQVTSVFEACGGFAYYFPISSTKTLYAWRSFITEFSPGIDKYQTYLNLPGIIIPNQEKDIFAKILSSLKVNDIEEGSTSATSADWKTYKNDKYGFEFQYPDDIKLEQPVNDVVVLKIGQNGGYLQIQNFVNKSSQPVSNYRPNGALPTKTVIIGGKTAQEYYTSSPQGEGVMVNLPYTDLVINFSDKSYIEIQYFASDSDKIIINQILSTLKFTK